MPQRKNKKRVFPVPTAGIKRELKKAAKKLKKMENMKLLPPKLKAVRLELALLRDCYNKLDNISGL